MTLQPTSSEHPEAKAAALDRHQLAIICLALPSLLLGVTAIYIKKESSSSDHITTWHAVRHLSNHRLRFPFPHFLVHRHLVSLQYSGCSCRASLVEDPFGSTGLFLAEGLKQRRSGNTTGHKRNSFGTQNTLSHFSSRLSGYLLFTTLILTVHLAGAWSTWSTLNSSYFARLLGYVVAPGVIIGSVFSRIRLFHSLLAACKTHSSFQRIQDQNFLAAHSIFY